MLPTSSSLVKYDNPILVSTKDIRSKVRSHLPRLLLNSPYFLS